MFVKVTVCDEQALAGKALSSQISLTQERACSRAKRNERIRDWRVKKTAIECVIIKYGG